MADGRRQTITMSETIFRPPARSQASRFPAPRSRASSRGVMTVQLPADAHPRHIWFESILEKRAIYLLAARPDTWDLREQPPAIGWTDEQGRSRQHVFDLLLTQRSGRRIAIAVKPARLAERRAFRDELMRIRAATPLSFAQDVVLVTDRSFTRAQALDAERLMEFRRTPDPDADAAIAALLRDLDTPATIAFLVARSGLEGRGFRAAFRAIFAGLARVVSEGPITPSSQIRAVARR